VAEGPAGNSGAAANGPYLWQLGGRMDEFDQADPLAVALNELFLLGPAQDRETIASLRDRLASRRLRVLVAGEAKRGKEHAGECPMQLGWSE
jgi:hypothetical protein